MYMANTVRLKIHVNNTYVESKYDPNIDDILDRELRYHPSGFIHSPKYKDGKWDGFNHLYERRARVFPSGLLDRAESALRVNGYSVIRNDQRTQPPVELPDTIELHGISLRERQLEAIDAAINGVRGVIKASTGFGKTEVFSGLTRALGVPTIVFVHRKDLLRQTAQRLSLRLGSDVKIGIVGDGSYDFQAVTVATFQTVGNLLKDKLSRKETLSILAQYDMMILDEAHHASSAPTYSKVVKAVPAFYRFGFSATPFKEPKGSEMHLVGMTGELLFDYELATAVDEGISVKPHCFMMGREQLDLDDGIDYGTLYDIAIIENKHRHRAVVDVCRYAQARKLPTVVIVERLSHGERLADELRWKFVSGQDPAERREWVRNQVNDGSLPGFISTVMDEGVDVPNLACVVLASGGKAPHRLIQRIGRGIRKGKHDFCLVVDFYDADNDTLESQTKSRLRTYKTLGFDVQRVLKLPELDELEIAA